MIQQGTPEWFAQRAGKVTASRISDVMAQGKGSAEAVTRRNYRQQLVLERLTGKSQERDFTSRAMEEGKEREEQARAIFSLITGKQVEEVAMISHPTIENAGASPDGLIIGEPEGLEIKCPQPAQHLATLQGEPPARDYMRQMQWGMACTGHARWNFFSFNPDFPDQMQTKHLIIPRDPMMIVEIEQAVRQFNLEVEAEVANLKAQYGIE